MSGGCSTEPAPRCASVNRQGARSNPSSRRPDANNVDRQEAEQLPTLISRPRRPPVPTRGGTAPPWPTHQLSPTCRTLIEHRAELVARSGVVTAVGGQGGVHSGSWIATTSTTALAVELEHRIGHVTIQPVGLDPDGVERSLVCSPILARYIPPSRPRPPTDNQLNGKGARHPSLFLRRMPAPVPSQRTTRCRQARRRCRPHPGRPARSQYRPGRGRTQVASPA